MAVNCFEGQEHPHAVSILDTSSQCSGSGPEADPDPPLGSGSFLQQAQKFR
jgi:hypothetical protein